MSPAKMFAYMKEREIRRELQEVQVSSNTRELLDEGEKLDPNTRITAYLLIG